MRLVFFLFFFLFLLCFGGGDDVERGGRGKEKREGGERRKKEPCLLWDADIDVVFIPRDIRIRHRRAVSFVEKGPCRDSVGWIVQLIERCSGIGGELRGIDAPIDDFRVRVSESTSRSRGGGRVESAHAVGMEGRQCSVDIFGLARCNGISAFCVGLGRCV